MAARKTLIERISKSRVVKRFTDPPPLVAVVRLSGVIGKTGGMRRGLTLENLESPLKKAFGIGRLEAVALEVNSPGGSPVQSALIHNRIRQLADEAEVPVFAFCEDVAASGGYWLACAADEIFVDSNSIIGSIGVVSAGFGFVDAIKKLGIERRVYTAGSRKSILDPFQPEKSEDVEQLKTIQRDMHESFKDLVRERRGAKLTQPEDELFDGAFWTGRRAWEMGLVDGLGDLRSTMRERYGENVGFKRIESSKRFPWSIGGARTTANLDGLSATALMGAVEERAWWARYGL